MRSTITGRLVLPNSMLADGTQGGKLQAGTRVQHAKRGAGRVVQMREDGHAIVAYDSGENHTYDYSPDRFGDLSVTELGNTSMDGPAQVSAASSQPASTVALGRPTQLRPGSTVASAIKKQTRLPADVTALLCDQRLGHEHVPVRLPPKPVVRPHFARRLPHTRATG